jgi:hypothetical protein
MRPVEIVSEADVIKIAKEWYVYSRLAGDRNWAREIIGAAMELSKQSGHPVDTPRVPKLILGVN